MHASNPSYQHEESQNNTVLKTDSITKPKV